jgi:hypothetical protein
MEALCTTEMYVVDYPEEPRLQPHHRAVMLCQGAEAEKHGVFRVGCI